MVIGASNYATIYSQEGIELAKRAEAEERQVTEPDGEHVIMTVLLSKEQSSKMTVGAVYQIKSSITRTGAYKLVSSEDERLPLRRHVFRSEARALKSR
jgi:hypothetical protein